MQYAILYRGALASCNYSCDYCPFAKHKASKASLEYDKYALIKFKTWLEKRHNDGIRLLFTPWGEALIHSYYQQTMIALSDLENISKIAIQTNLSASLDWLLQANRDKMALWTTFHPSETSLEKFLKKCSQLMRYNIAFSVGIVGLKENYIYAKLLREKLPKSIYVWINAYKDIISYYTAEEINQFNQIDPLFQHNLKDYDSFNKACFAGETVISIDDKGNIMRCHFIKEILGNIYQDALENILKPRVCTNQICNCYIGYIHIKELEFYDIFKQGLLERIPNISR